MRGFIHTVEIVVSAVLLLVALNQFSNVYPKPMDWGRGQLNIAARDLLSVTEGADWYDSDSVGGKISAVLDMRNVRYDARIAGGVDTVVSVGCRCSQANLDKIKSALRGFRLNGRVIRFDVYSLGASDSWDAMDVVVFDETTVAGDDAVKISTFAGKNKGVVEITAPSFIQTHANDAVQKNTFGLKWINGLGASAAAVIAKGEAGKERYRIANFFYGFPYMITVTRQSVTPTLTDEVVSCTDSMYAGALVFRSGTYGVAAADDKSACSSYLPHMLFADIDGDGKFLNSEGRLKEGEVLRVGGYGFTVKRMDVKNYDIIVEGESSAGWEQYTCTQTGEDVCYNGLAARSATAGAQKDFNVEFAQPGTYEVWIRSYRGPSSQLGKNSFYMSLEGGEQSQLVDPYNGLGGTWAWNKTTFTITQFGSRRITLRAGSGSGWQETLIDAFFLRLSVPAQNVGLLFREGYKFAGVQGGVYPIGDSADKVVVSDGQIAGAVINYAFAGGKGRAAWLHANDFGADWSTLLSSTLVWAAGGDVVVVSNPPLEYGAARTKTVFENEDMNVVYQFILTLWRG